MIIITTDTEGEGERMQTGTAQALCERLKTDVQLKYPAEWKAESTQGTQWSSLFITLKTLGTVSNKVYC